LELRGGVFEWGFDFKCGGGHTFVDCLRVDG
jgi:hypothetical protein